MDSAVSPGSSEPPESDRKEQDVRDGFVEGSEEAKGVMVVDLKKGNPSWVSVAQDKRRAGGSVEKAGEKDDESQDREGRTLRRESIETSENKVVKEDTISKEDNSNTWALVSPDKIGRVQSTPQREPGGVQISASKYSVLSLHEAEEGEILQLEGHEGGKQAREKIENIETKVMLLETRYRVAKMSLSLKTVLNRSGKMQSQGPRK
ncbi:hypothetical protein IGI04_040017 [Brassica rapa subsp. trilocularis]|uniref:Uncharacterized protein n=1 Tax=Brassica rapa subsp. trilocularis TaxID=1813537 RepID=A0ABQ7KN20_BRACM|nr:hypothetical protein IGI04_040017 [Brassica rapa subsp. trilocularis]